MRGFVIVLAFALVAVALATPTGAPAEEAAPVSKTATAITDAEARALVDAWLVAQNEGRVDAYKSLYANKFLGVKRAGSRVSRFDHDGWLRDRERMFRKKMVVKADAVTVSSAGPTAVVSFTQSWASGSFKDVGAKQLVLVREGGALRIAREEMLESMVVGADGGAKPISPEDFAFLSDGGGTVVVLNNEPGREFRTTGGPTLVSQAPAIVTKAAKVEALPADLAAWKGRAVTLYGQDGPVCRGTVSELLVMTSFWPHFGMEDQWRGDPETTDRTRPMRPAEIAKDAWEIGASARALVGRVTIAPDQRCDGAMWARATERPVVTEIGSAKGEAPDVAARALAALRTLKGYKAIQKGYLAEAQLAETRAPRAAEWTDYEGTKPSVVVLSGPGDRRFVAVSAEAGPGCGDFYGVFWAIWEVKNDKAGSLVLLTDETDPGTLFFPNAAADIDGDGRLELIGPDGLLRFSGPVLREVIDVRIPSYDCPC